MLWTFYMLAFIVSVQSGTDVINEGFNNGWTPITRDEVFNILDRKLLNREFAKDYINQNNIVTQKSDNNEEIIQEVIGPRYVNYINNRNGRQSYSHKGTESNKEKHQANLLSNGKNREPKEISSSSICAINDLASNINELTETLDNVSKDKLIEDASVIQYEVTERSEHGELLKQQEVFKLHRNKQIDKLNGTEGTNPEMNKFTSKLLNILSNYNIKVNDVLTNYEKSRKLKQNPPKQEYFLVPIRYSSKFNNFAPDPMLVVFLSNYGYYLPNQYGRNKYSNLYGHLASIHSKELDSYKIYSDTDSSQ